MGLSEGDTLARAVLRATRTATARALDSENSGTMFRSPVTKLKSSAQVHGARDNAIMQVQHDQKGRRSMESLLEYRRRQSRQVSLSTGIYRAPYPRFRTVAWAPVMDLRSSSRHPYLHYAISGAGRHNTTVPSQKSARAAVRRLMSAALVSRPVRRILHAILEARPVWRTL